MSAYLKTSGDLIEKRIGEASNLLSAKDERWSKRFSKLEELYRSIKYGELSDQQRDFIKNQAYLISTNKAAKSGKLIYENEYLKKENQEAKDKTKKIEDDYKKKVGGLETSIGELKESVGKLNESLETKGKENQVLNEKVGGLENKMEGLNNEL